MKIIKIIVSNTVIITMFIEFLEKIGYLKSIESYLYLALVFIGFFNVFLLSQDELAKNKKLRNRTSTKTHPLLKIWI